MGKTKFKVGDKVTPKKGYYAGKPGIITHLFTYDSRKRYCVIFDNKYETYYFWSYELLFADLKALADHYEKEDTVCGPYGYIPNFNKEEEKLNKTIKNSAIKFATVDSNKWKIGDIVRVSEIVCKYFPSIGKVINVTSRNEQYLYEIEFLNNMAEKYFEYQLFTPSINDLAFYDECKKISKITKDIEQKEVKKCQLCETPFDEIEESKEEPGVCEYCIEQRHRIPEVNLRKACNVDLNEFSAFGHEGDWLEVTEWTNHEGFDVTIHYANDHVETDHNFKLSYDELSAIMNIVNKFGKLPAIFTKAPEE